MDSITALLLARGLERLVISLAGLAALWMGWRLFYQIQGQPSQQAEFSFKDIAIRLQRVGPGIFFALFGSAILIVSIANPLSIEGDRASTPASADEADVVAAGSSNRSVNYLDRRNESEIQRFIVALNTVIDIGGLATTEEIVLADRELLFEATGTTEEVRNSLLELFFNVSEVAIWLRRRNDLDTNPALIPESEREIVRRVDELATRSLFDEDR